MNHIVGIPNLATKTGLLTSLRHYAEISPNFKLDDILPTTFRLDQKGEALQFLTATANGIDRGI